MTDFRFVHAADLHLDSPLTGLALRDGAMAARLRAAGREAMESLVAQTIEAGAAFLLIAGDVYDGDWRDYHTGLFFAGQMARLARAGIPAYLIHGNHDAESEITRRLTLPDNVHVFPTRAPGTLRDAGTGAVLHGQGFARRETRENLVPAYPEPVPGAFNIGLLHTGLGGLGGHANYAPCTLAELVAKGYDYWALGHVHQRAVLAERPHVVFPGNLQGRHVREPGARGAILVTVAGGVVDAAEFLPCDLVRWARLEVDAAGCTRPAEVHERLRAALESAAAAAEGRLLACRIALTGETALHGALLAGEDALAAEAQALALALGPEAAWIERVDLATRPPGAGAAPAALDDLARLIGEAAADPDLAARLAADPGDFARALPPEIRARADAPALRAALGGDTGALVREAGAWLLARLAGGA